MLGDFVTNNQHSVIFSFSIRLGLVEMNKRLFRFRNLMYTLVFYFGVSFPWHLTLNALRCGNSSERMEECDAFIRLPEKGILMPWVELTMF